MIIYLYDRSSRMQHAGGTKCVARLNVRINVKKYRKYMGVSKVQSMDSVIKNHAHTN